MRTHTFAPMSGAYHEYQVQLASSRDRFDRSPAARTLVCAETSPVLLEAFFLYFSALGVQMTAPVEAWIHRAGLRCMDLGYSSLGSALMAHSRHEAGHDALMARDARGLATRWNNLHEDAAIDVEALLVEAPSVAVLRYIELHESVLSGPAPFAQLAIELEIEALSVRLGAPVLDNLATQLGPPFVKELSFLTEHVAIDSAHTAFNERQLARFLDADSSALVPLVEAGRRALESYGGFLGECLGRAEIQVAKLDRRS